jgi:hypothetical protein
MPATRKTQPLRGEPAPASVTPEHRSAPHEFPSAWWTVLHATRSHARGAPAGRENDEPFVDIELG